jgi:hypothetical protein
VNRSKFTEEEVVMQEYQSLNHTKWDCKYHVVPKSTTTFSISPFGTPQRTWWA